MKKIFAIVFGLMLLTGVCMAGEKEELQLRKANIQLTQQLMSYQFKELQEAMKDVDARLLAISIAEKEKEKPKEKK